jgi:NHLM bacteriocin system ABC transporter ATP-binding protein
MLIDEFCETLGSLQKLGAGNRFNCNVPFSIWYVKKGAVDIFLQESTIIDEKSLNHFFRIDEGQIFFSSEVVFFEKNWTLIARSCSETEVYQFILPQLTNILLPLQEFIAFQLDEFIIKLSKLIPLTPSPSQYVDISNEEKIIISPLEVVSTSKGVIWVSLLQGQAIFNGDDGIFIGKDKNWFPLTDHSWFQSPVANEILIEKTINLFQKINLWDSIQTYYTMILKLYLIKIENEQIFNNIVLYDKIKNNQSAMKNSLVHLQCSFQPQPKELWSIAKKQDQLFLTCERLTAYYNIPLRPLNKVNTKLSPAQQFKQVMFRSKIFYRKVYLATNWYRNDHGPLFAIEEKKNKPIAIIPNGNEYFSYKSSTDQVEKIAKQNANQFYKYAYTIYRNFSNKILGIKDVIGFGTQYVMKDIAVVIACFSSISLLSFLPPVLTQIIFDNVIVSTDRNQLWQISLVLIGVIISMSAFELTKRYALLRFEATLDSQIQAAFWGRILKLPVEFFKKYTPGELVSRIARLMEVRMSFSGPMLILIMNALFSMISFILLLYYSAFSALIVFVVIAIMIISYVVFSKMRLVIEQKIAVKQDEIFGTLGEIFSAIVKIRLTGSEYRVFSHWAIAFSKLQSHIRKSSKISAFIKSTLDIAPLFIFGVAYTAIAFAVYRSQNLSTGEFLAFNVVLAQMLFAITDLLQVLNDVIEQIPSFSRAAIFIDTSPEVKVELEEPDDLKGDIEISNVSFKYPDSDNWVLNKISLEIDPGEYVAFVGPSGSGKSTLLRLLMRFESPTEGRIYFDNKDINQVDIDLLRKKMGVVLQNDQLIQGDIYTNISASNELTLSEVWEIAELVGIAEDIKEMPMQMRTMVQMEGTGLSGGQKERILIARAIANKPQLLMLDEATRALDNKTQKHIITQLGKMRMTRIVVAHRLTTLLEVDKIYVIDQGQCVESGTFMELMDKQNLFYRLANRQML